ncbi:MAG TPA: thioredoxin family protein [Steroidobacteraceae bacterium]|nr:thioredoxin family protein [Steroidobacteraceae bacterium]
MPASAPPGVAWFRGNLQQAFASAHAQKRLVFVYFGAVWCPPCQDLKATVFRRKDFLDRLSLYVPVYLDGDGPDAQYWADQLHVIGYPTVLILRSDRSEIERVSGGMDLGRYAEVLSLGLQSAQPREQLLQAIEHGSRSLSGEQCRALAYNGWDLDEDWIYADERPGALRHAGELLTKAATRCPRDAVLERARLTLSAAEALASAESDALKQGNAPSPALAAAVARVERIVAHEALVQDAGDALLDLPAAFFTAAARLDPAHAASIEASFSRPLQRLGTDPRYSTATQLDALHERLVVAKAFEPGGKLPAALAAEARRRTELELSRVHEPHARTAVVNGAENIFEALGDSRRLYSLLLDEIKTSATPYYYMVDLGDLEEQRGHKAAAIAWLQRAYEQSQGPATRIQWGSRYVRGLIRMRPEDEAAISSAALQVIGELRSGGAIHGRSRRALQLMIGQLHDWNGSGQHPQALAQIRAALGAACSTVPHEDAASLECGRFLARI